MKRLLTLVLAAFAFAACTQNEVEELSANRADVPETLTVGFEGADTRIELNEALKTVWTEGDEVSVFYRSDINQRWQYQGETGERVGDLRCVDAGSGTPTKTTKIVIAYPYSDSYYLNTESCDIQAMLPAMQSYKDGSYGAEGNIMVAAGELTQFTLKSIVGWLRVELTGEGEVVESITVRGNNGEQVAGLCYINAADASVALAESEVDESLVATEVELNCGDGIELGAEATEFYVALLPQTFENGMTVEVDYANGNSQTLVCENNVTIRRNHISPIESEANVEVEIPTNQLWYTATAKVKPYDASAFNVAIASNEWNEATGEGVITFDGELTTIGDEAFERCSSLTNVTIPDSVTTIGDEAFWICRSLTSVTIGDSVTTIGDSAFYGCESLTSVTIPDSVTTIGYGTFASCHSLAEFKGKFAADEGRCLIKDNAIIAYAEASGTTYTIPDSVTTIGGHAFYYCSSLTSVTIPDSVTTIGEDAFCYCRSLTSVTIPDSVTTIGDSAFYYCDSLTSVTIPDGVISIGDYAFKNCIAFTSVTIGNSVTSIGRGAFESCARLTSVTIPESVTTIGTGAFISCMHLQEFKGKFASDDGRCLIIDGVLNALALDELAGYSIPYGVTSIDANIARGSLYLTYISIPETVISIGDYAFRSCQNLSAISCEATVPPSLGSEVFYYTPNSLKIYVYSESVEPYKLAWRYDGICSNGSYGYGTTEINYTTTNGSTVNSQRLPIVKNTYENGVGTLYVSGRHITIPSCAFMDSTLKSITIPNGVPTIGDGAFIRCYGLASITIPNSVTTIGDNAFLDCRKLKSITIPNSVTTIGEGAFKNCDNLASVNITDVAAWCDISFDGEFANPFTYANNLYVNGELVADLVIPDSVTTIRNDAFHNIDCLTSVTIPNSVTTIGDYAFSSCDNLASITIPNSVTTIGKNTFSWCANLASVTIGDGVKSIGDDAFCYCRSLTRVTIGNSVTTIGDYAFNGCSSLTSVTIPDSVTTIGKNTFSWCANLASVTIGDGVKSIGDNAFYECINLKRITIPNSVTTIGNYAFYSCDNLASVTIPNSVTTIGNYAFYSCANLASVTIGDGVKSIGDYAFYWCDNLASITIPNSVTTIGNHAFNSCGNLASVTIGDGVKSIGFTAFASCSNLTSVYCKAITPPTLSLSQYADSNVFSRSATSLKIYVPRDSVNAYMSAEGWMEYADDIVGYDFE